MSEYITIDTEKDITWKNENITPLPVHGEDYFMLDVRIPEYKGEFPNAAMVHLAKRLRMTMKLYSGLGLSANQCGVAERMFVIGSGEFQLTCLNPKLKAQSAKRSKEKEGCLSHPGLFLIVDRPEVIEVEFLTEDGEKKEMTLEGITARCFLHELDHLDGVRYTKLVKPLALRMARQRANKLVKKIVRKNKNERLATRV
jgi:peptide deformylase